MCYIDGDENIGPLTEAYNIYSQIYPALILL